MFLDGMGWMGWVGVCGVKLALALCLTYWSIDIDSLPVLHVPLCFQRTCICSSCDDGSKLVFFQLLHACNPYVRMCDIIFDNMQTVLPPPPLRSTSLYAPSPNAYTQKCTSTRRKPKGLQHPARVTSTTRNPMILHPQVPRSFMPQRRCCLIYKADRSAHIAKCAGQRNGK